MQARITGTTMPVLEFVLEPNESIISEAGELSWMSSSIQMTTHTQFGGGGGLFGVLKRVAGGGIHLHDGISRHRRCWRAGFRHQTPRPHCSRGNFSGTRISDSSSRLSLRHSAGSTRSRLPAIAGRGDFRRRRIPAAASQRTRHILARTIRRTGDARSSARRNSPRTSRPCWGVSIQRVVSNHHCARH